MRAPTATQAPSRMNPQNTTIFRLERKILHVIRTEPAQILSGRQDHLRSPQRRVPRGRRRRVRRCHGAERLGQDHAPQLYLLLHPRGQRQHHPARRGDRPSGRGRARQGAQSKTGLCIPGLPAARRSDRARKHPAAPHHLGRTHARHGNRRGQPVRCVRHHRHPGQIPRRDLRRRKAAHRSRPRAHQPPATDFGRRADRQPGFQVLPRGH